MLFQEIHPFVRFARKFSPSPSNCGHSVVARDCRLFYLAAGAAAIAARGGESLAMRPGACLYLPAGCPYSIAPAGDAEHVFYIVNFDFTWEHAHFQQTIPLQKPGAQAECFAVPPLADAPFFAGPLFFSQMPEVESSLQNMEREFQNSLALSAMQLSAYMTGILVQMARARLCGALSHPRAVETMIRYIHAHYAQPLSNLDIARAVNYHPNYANQLFCQHTGQTLHQFLNGYRIQQALTLLLSTDLSISDIASRVGFSSVSQFTKRFCAHTGVPPTRYKTK